MIFVFELCYLSLFKNKGRASLGYALFGVGVEIAGITVSKIIVKWFKGKEMALAMGLEPRESDGKYIIRNIEEDTEITIEGIIKDDPTGNATIEGETKVQAIGSTLHIYLPKAETISVYTLSGLLYEQQDVSAGSTQIHLSKGMYLVKIGEGTYKIVIR